MQSNGASSLPCGVKGSARWDGSSRPRTFGTFPSGEIGIILGTEVVGQRWCRQWSSHDRYIRPAWGTHDFRAARARVRPPVRTAR